MLPDYKLLLLDVDGTIAIDNFLITSPVKKSIEEINKVMKVALISNRSQSSVSRYIKALNLSRNSLHTSEGGAKIMRGDGRVIYVSYVNRKSLLEVVDYLFKQGLPFSLCIDGRAKAVRNWKEVELLKLDSVTRLSVLGLGTVQVKKHVAFLKKVKGISVFKAKNVINLARWNIDITSKAANKGSAVKRLRMLLGVSKRQVVAVGDGFNDIPFILEAGFKVAMGNAPRELKKIADYLAPSVYDDGLVDVIERLKDARKK